MRSYFQQLKLVGTLLIACTFAFLATPAWALTSEEFLSLFHIRLMAIEGVITDEQLQMRMGAFLPYADQIALEHKSLATLLEENKTDEANRLLRSIFEGELAYAEKTPTYPSEQMSGLFELMKHLNSRDEFFASRHEGFWHRVNDLLIFDRAPLGVAPTVFRQNADWNYLANRLESLPYRQKARFVIRELLLKPSAQATFSPAQMRALLKGLKNDPESAYPEFSFHKVFAEMSPNLDESLYRYSQLKLYSPEVLRLFPRGSFYSDQLILNWDWIDYLADHQNGSYRAQNEAAIQFLSHEENRTRFVRYFVYLMDRPRLLESESKSESFQILFKNLDFKAAFGATPPLLKRVTERMVLPEFQALTISSLNLSDQTIIYYLDTHRGFPPTDAFEHFLYVYKHQLSSLAQLNVFENIDAYTRQNQYLRYKLDHEYPNWAEKVEWKVKLKVALLKTQDQPRAGSEYAMGPALSQVCNLIFSNPN